MKAILCPLLAVTTFGFWVLAWSTLDFRFIIIFVLILFTTWAITRLLMRYARTLAIILFGLLGIGFAGAMTTVPAFRDAIVLLVRETLQFEGARLFVWAVLSTVVFSVYCLARPVSSSTG